MAHRGETARSVVLFFQGLPFTDKKTTRSRYVCLGLKALKALTHQKPALRFCMLFFEVLPFMTLSSSVNGKTSKRHDLPCFSLKFYRLSTKKKQRNILDVSRPIYQERFAVASSVNGRISK